MMQKVKQLDPNESRLGVKVLKNEGFLKLNRLNWLIGS